MCITLTVYTANIAPCTGEQQKHQQPFSEIKKFAPFTRSAPSLQRCSVRDYTRRPASRPPFNIETKILNNNMNPFQFKALYFSSSSFSSLAPARSRRAERVKCLLLCCINIVCLRTKNVYYPILRSPLPLGARARSNRNGNGFGYYGKLGKYR